MNSRTNPGEQETAVTLSRYVSELAEGVNSLSDELKHKNADELIQDASRLAQRNPGLFLLGSVAIGFGLARIAKVGEPGAQAHGEPGETETTAEATTIGQTATGTTAAGETAATGSTHAGTTYQPETGR